MKVRLIIAAGFILVILAICLVNFRTAEPDDKHTVKQAFETQNDQNNAQQKSSTQINSTPVDTRLRHLPNGYVEYKPALETSGAISAAETTDEALMLIQQVLSHYRYAYQENPVGVENFEITEQLLGRNPKKIIFIAADNPALRGNELVDQWNTPYFFHALSGQTMEIYSAGPDQKLWTADDVVLAENNF